MRIQKGFTLIELVVVIVILGILAATALPRFINMSVEANTAAAAGVAGGVSSAAAINYAARVAGNAQGVAYASATPCAAAALNTIMQTPLDAQFAYAPQVAGATCAAAAAGTPVNCTVTPASGAAAVATVICVP